MGEHWTVVFHVSSHYLPRGWSIGERKEGGGGGEKKNTPARSHCSFGKLRSWANRVSDWCGVALIS